MCDFLASLEFSLSIACAIVFSCLVVDGLFRGSVYYAWNRPRINYRLRPDAFTTTLLLYAIGACLSVEEIFGFAGKL